MGTNNSSKSCSNNSNSSSSKHNINFLSLGKNSTRDTSITNTKIYCESNLSVLRKLDPERYACPHEKLQYNFSEGIYLHKVKECKCAVNYLEYYDKHKTIPLIFENTSEHQKKYTSQIFAYVNTVPRQIGTLLLGIIGSIAVSSVIFGSLFALSYMPVIEILLDSLLAFKLGILCSLSAGIFTTLYLLPVIAQANKYSTVNWKIINQEDITINKET